MANYDFSTLNSSDLEELVCDLLNYEQLTNSLIKYKTFKDGKDAGIDLVYSTDNNDYEHVGQVKHYYRTGYAGLYNVLKDEVKKVVALNPSKYIVATSVDLSKDNTDAIKKLFDPYIKSLNDIYGQKDLNRLISNYPKILNQHYKLWLSDFSILNKILKSDLEFRSSYFLENELKKRLRLYVKTSVFDSSRDLLKKNNFIIITGEPGVGKTTLAEMLIYEYIAEGYNLSYILDDIKEAEKVLVPDESKQIIYFDDFLGSNKVEINKAKGSETVLRSILRRISKAENKVVIFTTRTFLLKTAVEESEKLKAFNIQASSSLIQLKDYNDHIKRNILINHINESDINLSLKDILRDEKIENFIINHSSFSPRSIEFITTNHVVENFSKSDFENFIYKNFDYPDEIWKHAYSEQITENERLLLSTLMSFGELASVKELEHAFNNRMQFEVEKNGRTKEMYIFRKTLNKLNGGFVIVRDNVEVEFINPSLIDFLQNYLREDIDEVNRIILSVKYVSQLTTRLFSLGSSANKKMPKELEERILRNYLLFINDENRDFDLIQLALVIYKYIDNDDKEDIICDIISNIKQWTALYYDYSLNLHFKNFIISVKDNETIYSVLQYKIEEIVSELFKGSNDLKEAIDLLGELIDGFNIDVENFDKVNITDHLDYLFSEHIGTEVQWLFDWMTFEDEAHERIQEVEKLVKRVNDYGIEYEGISDQFNYEWHDIAMENELARLMAKDD